MTQYQCNSCDFTNDAAVFNHAQDLHQRLDEAGPYTELECPLCGALSYRVETQAPFTPLASVVDEDERIAAEQFVRGVLNDTLDINLTEKKQQKLTEITLRLAGYANGLQQFKHPSAPIENDDYVTSLLNYGLTSAGTSRTPYHYGLTNRGLPCHVNTRVGPTTPLRFVSEQFEWNLHSATTAGRRGLVIVAVHAPNQSQAKALINGFASLNIKLDPHFAPSRDQSIYPEAEIPYVELSPREMIPNPGWHNERMHEWPYHAGKQTPKGTPCPYPADSYQAGMFQSGQNAQKA